MGAIKLFGGRNKPEYTVQSWANSKLMKCQKINNYHVSMINYPAATNFEGNKILLTNFDPREKTGILDPHFREKTGIIARFEPTEFGWILACQTAVSLL